MIDSISEEIRQAIDSTIEVYYVKDQEKNLAREKDKADSIAFITEQTILGPMPGGTSEKLPLFTSTFGGDIWEADKKAIATRDKCCVICGGPVQEIHHIRPRFLHGSNHPRNLVGLCLECHDEVHRRIDNGIQKVLEGSLDGSDLSLYKRNNMEEWIDNSGCIGGDGFDQLRSKLKTMLEDQIDEVTFTRDPAENRKREKKRRDFIKWILDETLTGPIIGGTISSPPYISYEDDRIIRRAILMRDEYCPFCGGPTKEVHHIRPRSLHGHDHPRNLIGLCFDCHEMVHRDIEKGIQDVLEDSLNITDKNKKTLDDFIGEPMPASGGRT